MKTIEGFCAAPRADASVHQCHYVSYLNKLHDIGDVVFIPIPASMTHHHDDGKENTRINIINTSKRKRLKISTTLGSLDGQAGFLVELQGYR